MIQADSKTVPPTALQLGYAGVLPFAALAVVACHVLMMLSIYYG